MESAHGRDSDQPGPGVTAERAFWRAGLHRVAGVDEVGRGALAGPLVAAAVVLPCCKGRRLARLLDALHNVRDSKLLTPNQRDRLLATVCGVADHVAVGAVEAAELDIIGVGPANRQAMQRAVLALPRQPDALVLDACVLDLGLPQVGLINGDATCLSIAAASIVAKVVRDRFMIEAHAADPRFGFDAHKGYGTSEHFRALACHGPGSLHRRCFAPVARALEEIRS